MKTSEKPIHPQHRIIGFLVNTFWYTHVPKLLSSLFISYLDLFVSLDWKSLYLFASE